MDVPNGRGDALTNNMNLPELKAALDAADVSDRAYSFTSDGIGEVHRVQRIQDALGPGWEVYYSERGQKNMLLLFRSESEAYEELLRRLLRDPLTRRSAFSRANSEPI